MSMFTAVKLGSMHRSADANNVCLSSPHIQERASGTIMLRTHARDPQHSAGHVRRGGWMQYGDTHYIVADVGKA